MQHPSRTPCAAIPQKRNMRFRARTVHEPNPTAALTKGRITGLLTNADRRCHEGAQPRPATQHFLHALVRRTTPSLQYHHKLQYHSHSTQEIQSQECLLTMYLRLLLKSPPTPLHPRRCRQRQRGIHCVVSKLSHEVGALNCCSVSTQVFNSAAATTASSSASVSFSAATEVLHSKCPAAISEPLTMGP